MVELGFSQRWKLQYDEPFSQTFAFNFNVRHYTERLRNLHFSFVVLLRALRKAAPALAGTDA
jgi:hypothetical protein